jgi:D-3-phosphoglycerate dehydrogenase / 2-oxoglutarate reductase
MKKVLVTEFVENKALDIIREVAEAIYLPEVGMDDYKRLAKDVIAIVLNTTIQMTSDVMDLSPQLKVISRTGTGTDNVDKAAATERGILVLHTPDATTISVAEHTVALICAITKQLPYPDRELRKGNFKTVRRLYQPIDLDGKTLGIVGFGRIGKEVARKCMNAFNMKILVYDSFISDSDLPLGVTRYTSEKQVFSEADIISLHMPLTDATRNHVNESLLSLMKPTSYLINTSRGRIVDEQYLAGMLRERRLAGAAFDVLANEPPALTDDLLNAPNAIITPHCAPLTKECFMKISCEAATGIVDWMKGKTPKYVYNREVLKIFSQKPEAKSK